MRRLLSIATLIVLAGCGEKNASAPAPAQPSGPRPSILLVTLDTTRADAIGPATPSFNALAVRGRRFTQAYATVPQTLPAHASMFTGLYPAGHGVRENGRYLGADQPLVAEKLRGAGYRTAAFVSAFAVARRFGLGRGFERYDDEFGDAAERTALETTDRAVEYLGEPSTHPTFLWVHYYDPHYPYTPPEPYRTRFAKQPYLGEVASMDEQLGRLIQTFEQQALGPKAIIVLADHGEGLGDHGEAQHGNLLYQSTMLVPLVVVAPGVATGTNDTPVSTRRIFHTILDLAGIDASSSLRRNDREIVAGEAMKPFLDYGWQPQVMAIEGRQKAIFAGRTEVYDVIGDPGETRDLASQANLSRGIRATLREYPIPSQTAQSPASLDEEARRKLASLGYIASTVKPVIRADAPRPADMAPLFDKLDRASALFVRSQYAQAIPVLEEILGKDPHNLDAALRLATAHSSLGHDQQALTAYIRAESISPDSMDVRTYLGLHYARTKEWEKAVPQLERVVAAEPDRLPALEGLAVVRERQGRFEDALQLREKIVTMRAATASELIRMAELAMRIGNSPIAMDSFEQALALQGPAFKRHLDLGVVYLSLRQLHEAAKEFEKVPRSSPDYPMALFKRAQVSAMLREPDASDRIATARRHADGVTRELIAREQLFR